MFYLTDRWDPNRYKNMRVRVDLGVMVIKGYSTFSKAPGLEFYHQMQFSLILRTLVERFLPFWRGAVCVFYSPSQQGSSQVEGEPVPMQNHMTWVLLSPWPVTLPMLTIYCDKHFWHWGGQQRNWKLRSSVRGQNQLQQVCGIVVGFVKG